MVEIVLYKPTYKNDFIRLNREWIETYFKIEASDIETFSHVDEIIEQGGQIFIALNVSLAGKARVNSISPGWIDTDFKEYEGADAVQQPAGRVGNPMDIANMVLYLCSDKAGFITGENICIDGGMTRQMIYNGDYGWTLKL